MIDDGQTKKYIEDYIARLKNEGFLGDNEFYSLVQSSFDKIVSYNLHKVQIESMLEVLREQCMQVKERQELRIAAEKKFMESALSTIEDIAKDMYEEQLRPVKPDRKSSLLVLKLNN